MTTREDVVALPDGTVYSRRKNFCTFDTSRLDSYASIIGENKMTWLLKVAQRLKGLKLLELSSTARGGGVAEMLYSAIPFMNSLGIEAEWNIIPGKQGYFECTKQLHNLLQGMKGSFTTEMQQVYHDQLMEYSSSNPIDFSPDVVMVHDPQPLGITRHQPKNYETWIWRCHIDIEPIVTAGNGVLDSISELITDYDAAIFSAIHYVFPHWPLPKYVIPPFIDPLSEKNRELSSQEIDRVLDRYQIDRSIPIIAQISRFDPWKGLDRTVAVYRRVRQERPCQLIIAGGLADDDPEGERVLADLCEKTKNDRDIHILKLSLANRLNNYHEVNALQRAADIIMQPSTREGFGLVITEALWKGKPVIASNVGGIPFQIQHGHNGYFYKNAPRTAAKVISLLDNPQMAKTMGRNGRHHVRQHFLLPDRMGDYLLAIDIAMNSRQNKKLHAASITSFHPWSTLDRRR